MKKLYFSILMMLVAASGYFEMNFINSQLNAQTPDLTSYKSLTYLDLPESQRKDLEIIKSTVIIQNKDIEPLAIEKVKDITLKCDLMIQDDGSDTNKIFFRTGRIKADPNGNIYIAQNNDCIIRKFDAKGNFLCQIGHKGQGPGEFLEISNMKIHHDNILYVADSQNKRISKFTLNGKFLNSIALKSSNSMAGIEIDGSGNIYLSYYDRTQEKVIHQYHNDVTYLKSFGAPLFYGNPPEYIYDDLQEMFANGYLSLHTNSLFFSRQNPYEIRQYDLNGNLLKKIFRQNKFMPVADVKKKDDRHIFILPVMSNLIFVYQDLLFNIVRLTPNKIDKNNCLIDVFDLKGHLLKSVKMKNIDFRGIDSRGHLYGISLSNDDAEQIVRYKLNVNLQ
ncbi:NHL repeat-containing protein [candidate division KSB1 bacterium]|nr:NHL repeat-containing protein [candidate division KSB1 bacterium]